MLLLQKIIFSLLHSCLHLCYRFSVAGSHLRRILLQKMRGKQKQSHTDLSITGYIAMAKLKNLHNKLVR